MFMNYACTPGGGGGGGVKCGCLTWTNTNIVTM